LGWKNDQAERFGCVQIEGFAMLFFFAVLDRLNIVQVRDKIRCCSVEVNFLSDKAALLAT